MKLSVFLLALALPALAFAAKAPKAPKAPVAPALASPAPTPAPPQGRLTLRLKDGQTLAAKLEKYDRYFISVSNSKGTQFDVPWSEVEAVDSDELVADLPLMRGSISPEPSAVSSLIERRAPGQAFAKAFWPGLLLHGSGHRYAGDNDAFVSLAGAELFGLVVGGFGASELFGVGKAGETKDTALALTVGGAAIFGLTWVYDLAFAPGAARKFNQAKGLALEPRLNGAQLAYHF